jgi:hypothetical protein
MLRGDNRAYPHAIYALHGNDAVRALDMLAHKYLGAELDNPARTVSPILVDVLRGDLAPQGCLHVSVESASWNYPPLPVHGAELGSHSISETSPTSPTFCLFFHADMLFISRI